MTRRLKLLALAVIVLTLFACSSDKQYRNASGVVWATTYNITYKSPVDLTDSIIATMNEVEMSLSPFNPESTISRINRGENVAIDRHIRAVFNESKRISQLTVGMFDPTVAPLVSLWGFGHKKSQDTKTAPTQQAIDSALQLVGISQCRINGDRIVKKHPLTEFNFSAITKGYGIDCIAQMMRRNGCTDYMIEIGGEIALSGKSPRGGKWCIQIDEPTGEESNTDHNRLKTVEVTDCCIATSGNYRNYRVLDDGSIASHTISPTTGRPIRTNLLSATVFAPSAMTADALATSAMALGNDSLAEVINMENGVQITRVFLNADGTFRIE